MNRLLKWTVFIITFCGLTGCGAYTKISSSTNPTYQGKQYKSLLVEARDHDGNQILGLEWTFRRKMDTPSLLVFSSSDLFDRQKNYTHEEKVKMLKERKIEAVLLINLDRAYTKSTYHPPTVSTSQVKNKKTGLVEVKTTTTDGYTSSTSYQKHTLILLDGQDLKPVWTSSASTSGDDSSSDMQDFYNALANAAIKSLRKDGLVFIPEK
ncbi:MAG: hypothetical protein JNK65_04525 [Deltaproteobacteria bacterium]|nr:hypothetical protein [Deltaproteobacteria bacterium]